MNKYETVSPREPRLRKLPMLSSGEERDCCCHRVGTATGGTAQHVGWGAEPTHSPTGDFYRCLRSVESRLNRNVTTSGRKLNHSGRMGEVPQSPEERAARGGDEHPEVGCGYGGGGGQRRSPAWPTPAVTARVCTTEGWQIHPPLSPDQTGDDPPPDGSPGRGGRARGDGRETL